MPKMTTCPLTLRTTPSLTAYKAGGPVTEVRCGGEIREGYLNETGITRYACNTCRRMFTAAEIEGVPA